MFLNQPIKQTLRQTGLGRSVILRAGKLGAEKVHLTRDERDEIRFLAWGVCVYRHTVRGFSPTHILSSLHQQDSLQGDWLRAGLEGCGFRGAAMRDTLLFLRVSRCSV